MTRSDPTAPLQPEALLRDFTPSFDFTLPPPLPEAEFVTRLRRIRREAVLANYDAIVVHADMVGYLHTSNAFLRYICDWAREGVLVIPTDDDLPLHLLSFFTESVVLPPYGEPPIVEHIWQIAPSGRETVDRPGSADAKTAAKAADLLAEMGLDRSTIALIGDAKSAGFWSELTNALPGARTVKDRGIVDRMQRVRSSLEQEQIRAAAQLCSIGYEAMCHVARPGATDRELYAAFTFAQLARGGESADGYQLGVNRYGTACGKPYGHVLTAGDILNLYVSNVVVNGYGAQIARMLVVGDITDKQEEVLAMCVDGVKRGAAAIKTGATLADLHHAAFTAYLERGYLTDDATRTMPFNWAAMDDGTARYVPHEYVADADLEAQGRRLNHVYPATTGPHNPNLGHAVGMPGLPMYRINSNSDDPIEAGMSFVLHSQWLEPKVAGCNVGDCFQVLEGGGVENASAHTPLEPFRVPV